MRTTPGSPLRDLLYMLILTTQVTTHHNSQHQAPKVPLSLGMYERTASYSTNELPTELAARGYNSDVNPVLLYISDVNLC